MLAKDNSIQEMLREKKIRLSHQRLMVLEYMSANHCHPTADQIFNGLKGTVPSLSKTTIYNTMDAFLEAGLVRPVNIEDNEVRYDIVTEEHGHFKCDSCGRIYDFELDLDHLTSGQLASFKIDSRDVYFRGICSECLKHKS